jgi:hypothetical protein
MCTYEIVTSSCNLGLTSNIEAASMRLWCRERVCIITLRNVYKYDARYDDDIHEHTSKFMVKEATDCECIYTTIAIDMQMPAKTLRVVLILGHGASWP